jgi:hypothetical protein
MISDIFRGHKCSCGNTDISKFHRIEVKEYDTGEVYWYYKCDNCQGMYCMKVSEQPRRTQ